MTSIDKKPLTIKTAENSYIIYLDSTNLIQLVNDTSNRSFLVFKDNRKVFLDFYITPIYLHGAYLCDINEVGKMLILESAPVGCSGLSASITNVSIILLNDSVFGKVYSYNSFNGGIDLLEYDNNKLVANIYQYQSTDDSNNAIYCKYLFELTPKGFIMQDVSPKCLMFSHEDYSLKRYNCECGELQKPYVY